MKNDRKNNLKDYLPRFVGIFALLCDQLSKYIVMTHPPFGPITSWMNITFVENHGIIWGLSQEYGTYFAAFGTMGLGIILIKTDLWSQYKYISSLLLAGCMGNLIDRLHHGSVIDWIDWHAYGYHWPAFNLADAYLLIALCLLLYYPQATPFEQ